MNQLGFPLLSIIIFLPLVGGVVALFLGRNHTAIKVWALVVTLVNLALACVPWAFFAYGFGNSLIFPVAIGATVLLMPGQARPKAVLEAIETYRPTVVFGPNNYANVYNLIDKIYKKRFIFVGTGKNIKSVAYVENLVDATIFALEKLEPGIRIFNYSDEPQMTIGQIVETIGERIPHELPRMKLPLGIATSLGSIFDLLAKVTGRNLPITAARMKKFATPTHHRSEKIRKMGFKQKVPIKEGFGRMVEWYLQTQVK